MRNIWRNTCIQNKLIAELNWEERKNETESKEKGRKKRKKERKKERKNEKGRKAVGTILI